MATGNFVRLPLYPGYKYVAYGSMNIEEVCIIKYIICSNSNLKAGTLTIYTERPEKLIYHDRCFHVMDIKVFNIIVLELSTGYLFSCVTVLMWNLDQLVKSSQVKFTI